MSVQRVANTIKHVLSQNLKLKFPTDSLFLIFQLKLDQIYTRQNQRNTQNSGECVCVLVSSSITSEIHGSLGTVMVSDIPTLSIFPRGIFRLLEEN